MARWSASVERPCSYDYHGYTLCKTGPWGQGPVALQQLALLKGFGLDGLSAEDPDFVHTVVECAKLAFADREAFYGDPEFVRVPMETLLSDGYNDERRKLVGERASRELRPGHIPGHGAPPIVRVARGVEVDVAHAGAHGAGEPTTARFEEMRVSRTGGTRGDTCHLDVIDRWGNMQTLEAGIAVLQGQRRAKLRLPARALQEDDEMAGHRQGELAAEILLDQRQRQIDSGGDAGRGPDVAVADEDRVGLQAHGGKASGEFGAAPPVRHGATAIEQAGGRQQKGAAADRRGPPRRLRPRLDPADEFSVLAGRIDAGAAGDDQRVQGHARGGEFAGRETQAGRCRHQRSVGHHDGIVGARTPACENEIVGRGEDLERPGDVEQLDSGEGQDLHPERRWRETRALWHVRQMMYR